MGFGVLPQPQGVLAGYGFVVALPQEARTLCRKPPRAGHVVSLEGKYWLGVSGMGAVRARQMALMLIAQGARGLVSWGTCGGLAPELPAGALIMASHVVAVDGTRYVAARLSVTALASALTSPVRSGALLSVSHPVTTVLEKTALYQQFGALGVDMESVELARTAAEYGVEFLALRVVVDPATDALPMALVGAVDDLGAMRLWPLLAALGISPRKWGELWRLSRHFGQARHTLTALGALMRAGAGPFRQPKGEGLPGPGP